MCKKLLVAAVALVVGLSVVKHTSLGSLFQVWWKDARASVESKIPIETEIRQLGIEIDRIERDLKKNVSALALDETECQGLEEQVVALRTKQAQVKENIAAMEKLLDKPQTERISFNHVTYRPYELTRKLDAAVSEYNGRKADLQAKERLLDGKKRKLEAKFQLISAWRDKRDQLRVTAAQLETDVQMLRLEQMEAKVEFDESQVGKCNERVANIKKRLNQAKAEIKYAAKLGLGTDLGVEREPKTTEEVLKSARQALQDDDGPEKVATGKK